MTVITRRRQIFLLLIGIDHYQYSPHIPRLYGAVSDANAFHHFFVNAFNVPSKNIRVLHNEAATRKAIIDGLSNLKDDERIHPGDAIFIFFAGHGSEINAPEGWEAGGDGSKIQVIIPHDYSEVPGQEVQAIPDRTIGALLEGIAEEKGNNITVVLDCCHSASGTRGLIASAASGVRSGPVDPSIHDAQLDRPIWDARPWSPPRHRGLHSHVLLAACSAGELAREENARGIFTGALLEVFLTGDVTKMKYNNILQSMGELRGQHPQCEGVHQNRYLFNPEDLPPSPTLYTPSYQRQFTNGGSHYVFNLNAGSAHGLAIGDELTVYADEEALSEQPLGTLIVDKIDNFSATLKLPPDVTELRNFTSDAVAVKSKSGPKELFKLALPPFEQTPLLHSLLQSPNQEFNNISTADCPDEAHLTVVSHGEGGELSLQVTDPRVTEHGALPAFKDGKTIKPEELPEVLKSAMDYFWELDRTNPSSHLLRDDIKVEVYQLKDGKSHFDDVQHDLCAFEPDLHEDGKIVLGTGESIMFGIKLTNTSAFDIFPKVYYFDPDNLSIDAAYEPPIGLHGPAVPLRKKDGTLTIGYGSGGRCPFSPPPLKDGAAKHVGFLKIFLYTQSIDPAQPRSPTRHFALHRDRPQPTWDTILIPVVQHRSMAMPLGKPVQPVQHAHAHTRPQSQAFPLAGR